jgi:hypothetical protein
MGFMKILKNKLRQIKKLRDDIVEWRARRKMEKVVVGYDEVDGNSAPKELGDKIAERKKMDEVDGGSAPENPIIHNLLESLFMFFSFLIPTLCTVPSHYFYVTILALTLFLLSFGLVIRNMVAIYRFEFKNAGIASMFCTDYAGGTILEKVMRALSIFLNLFVFFFSYGDAFRGFILRWLLTLTHMFLLLFMIAYPLILKDRLGYNKIVSYTLEFSCYLWGAVTAFFYGGLLLFDYLFHFSDIISLCIVMPGFVLGFFSVPVGMLLAFVRSSMLERAAMITLQILVAVNSRYASLGSFSNYEMSGRDY